MVGADATTSGLASAGEMPSSVLGRSLGQQRPHLIEAPGTSRKAEPLPTCG